MSPFNNYTNNRCDCPCEPHQDECSCQHPEEIEEPGCHCKCVSCVGPQGPKGDTGPIGAQGVQGPAGEKGDTGATGPQGPAGEKGDTGATGPQGLTGAQGVQGPAGEKGDTGATGPQGLTGPQGVQGLAGEKGDPGATGPKGDTGDIGPRGDMGPIGTQGVAGLQGPQGVAGPAGPQGVQGAKGDTGLTGSQGPVGATGPQGVQGVKGDTGLTGPQGPVGATGPQGVQGPKGDPGCSCGQPGPTGAQGPAGPSGGTGAQGPEGKSGGMICPCEITFGKVLSFLLENEFSFDATIDAGFPYTLSSTLEEPAVLYNTWGIEFFEETVVPLCKLEALYLSFSTLQEREAFVSLVSVVLNQTLSCCHACGVCDVCEDTLAVDQYHSIIEMPATCNYEYYLSAECSCVDSMCQTIAKPIDLCNFVNTTGEKLRGILERKKAEGKVVTLISTQKDELLPETVNKNIEATGLSSVLLSYDSEGAFDVALICLERVTVVEFTEETI